MISTISMITEVATPPLMRQRWNHKKIITEMRYYGVCDKELHIPGNDLLNKKQYVEIDNEI